MIADISSGNSGFADVMFLVGLILFLIAAAAFWARPTELKLGLVGTALGLAAVALGWLVL